ncbi:MAG: glycosyltransferase family 39 protein [Planctomycetota bacterium]
MTEKHDRWILLALASCVLFPSLARRDAWPPDEARYTVVARNLLQSRELADFFVLHLNGGIYPDKPPLYFWAAAAVGALTGSLNAWQARLPSALAGLVTLLLCYELGRRLVDRRTAFLGALMLLATPQWVYIAQRVALDMLLSMWVVASVLCHVRALENLDAGRRRRAWWWHASMFACWGSAVLTKGPVGVVVPLLGLLGGAALKSPWCRLRAIPWLRGLGILLVVVALWLVPALLLTDGAFATEVLWRQSAGRMQDSFAHAQPFWYFAQTFPVNFLPWSLVLIGGLVWLWRMRRRAEGGSDFTARGAAAGCFLGAWLLAVLLFFSCISGKRAVYLMPIYPAAALLAAIVVGRVFVMWPRAIVRTSQAAATLAVLVGAGMFVWCSMLDRERSGRGVGEMVRAAIESGRQVVACEVHRVEDVLYFADLSRLDEVAPEEAVRLVEEHGERLGILTDRKRVEALAALTGGRLAAVASASIDRREYVLMGLGSEEEGPTIPTEGPQETHR